MQAQPTADSGKYVTASLDAAQAKIVAEELQYQFASAMTDVITVQLEYLNREHLEQLDGVRTRYVEMLDLIHWGDQGGDLVIARTDAEPLMRELYGMGGHKLKDPTDVSDDPPHLTRGRGWAECDAARTIERALTA